MFGPDDIAFKPTLVERKDCLKCALNKLEDEEEKSIYLQSHHPVINNGIVNLPLCAEHIEGTNETQ